MSYVPQEGKRRSIQKRLVFKKEISLALKKSTEVCCRPMNKYAYFSNKSLISSSSKMFKNIVLKVPLQGIHDTGKQTQQKCHLSDLFEATSIAG